VKAAKLFVCTVLSACTVVPLANYGVSPPESSTFTQAIDWQAAGDEAAVILSQYLQIDTSNPPGNETRGAQFLAQILNKEAIAAEIVEFAPGRGSLIARLEPQAQATEKPLCLLSHIDVVPAETAKWPVETPPFGGVIDKAGVLWGRGALDMKGMGALETLTLVWLKRQHVALKRAVILLAVADEEVDNRGVRFVIDKHWGKIDCSQLINEGGVGLKAMLTPGQTVFGVSTAEKGLLWLKLTAHGPAGHGSTPVPGRAPEKLLRALDKIRARQPQPNIHPILYNVLAQSGYATGGIAGFVLKRPWWVRRVVLGKLMASAPARAGVTNTINITGFAGMNEPNVVPSEVQANLDCRLLPGVKPYEMLEEIKTLIDDPDISLQVLHEAEANESPLDDPFFAAIARNVLKVHADAVVGPVLSPGFTDSIKLRPLGVHAYGLVPFVIDLQEAGTIHGANERVSLQNIRDGLRILYGAVLDMVARPAAAEAGRAQ